MMISPGPGVSLTLSPYPTCDPRVLGQVSKLPQVPAKDAWPFHEKAIQVKADVAAS
jgi:hypothetical protein